MNSLLAILESGQPGRFDNTIRPTLPHRDALGHAPSLSSWACGCAHCERTWRERGNQ